jgi:hypothetical protein
MAVEHRNLTGSQLHEPKGAEAAALDTVYTSNGTGSGAWQSPLKNLLNANRVILSASITDISTVSSAWAVSPFAGRIIKIYVVLYGSTSTANDILTAYIGGVAVTNSAVTVVQAGSVAGSTFNSTPTALNTVTAGQAIEVRSDGGSSATQRAEVFLIIDTSV